jgi:pyrroline-5-carboxylate reductase
MMFEHRKIAFIGPGVMAEAMIGGLIRREVASPGALTAAGPTQERLEYLAGKYGVPTTSDNAQAARKAEVVVLSVKPQRLDKVMAGLRGAIQPNALVLSIIAGATIDKLSHGLGHTIIVRSMPNTPALIGEGITVWTSSARVNAEQLEMARQILGALGEEIYVEEETYLDMATALSGTGPAYVFLFIHLARLRNQVTSPGGTTAAALYFLEKAGFRTAISRAVWAAYERTRELGKGGKSHAPEDTSEGG